MAVLNDRIEQEITIEAPLERVWDLVTTPGWWVPADVEQRADRTPGHQTVRQSEKYGRYLVEVVSMDPRTYAAFRWASQFPNEELAPGKTTLIEFRVEPAAGGVNVKVVESGFAGIDADEAVRKAGFDANTAGWTMELGSLKERAEQSVAA
ncbi:MAG: SRPBCC domain-containing protein [Actinocrinis sp.]